MHSRSEVSGMMVCSEEHHYLSCYLDVMMSMSDDITILVQKEYFGSLCHVRQ
jgi:hypothetical protein